MLKCPEWRCPSVQLQINYLDWESPVIASRQCYETARKFGKEIVVMEPIKGGGLVEPVDMVPDKSRLADLALSFVANQFGHFAQMNNISNETLRVQIFWLPCAYKT